MSQHSARHVALSAREVIRVATAASARIVQAAHERLIVTYSIRDDVAYVLTPPGQDPAAVMYAARLVLPDDTYQELASHLGVSADWTSE